MCGRFNIIDDKGMRDLLRTLGFDFNFPTRINIAPAEPVPVMMQAEQEREIHEMRWWLTPSWAPEVTSRFSMFNARSETLDTSKAFRGPFRHKRGIMPASSFIEWRKLGQNKQPYLIRPLEGAFVFAAIWDQWEKSENYIESCAMITTAADSAIDWLHHRMPVMLPWNNVEEWLDKSTPQKRLQEIMHQGLPGDLQAVPISTKVNNAREKDPGILVEEGDPVRITRH